MNDFTSFLYSLSLFLHFLIHPPSLISFSLHCRFLSSFLFLWNVSFCHEANHAVVFIFGGGWFDLGRTLHFLGRGGGTNIRFFEINKFLEKSIVNKYCNPKYKMIKKFCMLFVLSYTVILDLCSQRKVLNNERMNVSFEISRKILNHIFLKST